MKTTNALVWAAVAGLFSTGPAFAKDAQDSSIFKGRYKGPVTVTGPGSASSGVAKVIITSGRRGKSATIDYTATVADGMGGSTVLPAVMTLDPNKQMSVTDLGVGIAGTNNAKPGTGTWSQRKRKLKFNATNGDMDLRGTAAVRDAGKKRKLKLTLVSTDAGGSTVFSSKLKARVPKK